MEPDKTQEGSYTLCDPTRPSGFCGSCSCSFFFLDETRAAKSDALAGYRSKGLPMQTHSKPSVEWEACTTTKDKLDEERFP